MDSNAFFSMIMSVAGHGAATVTVLLVSALLLAGVLVVWGKLS